MHTRNMETYFKTLKRELKQSVRFNDLLGKSLPIVVKHQATSRYLPILYTYLFEIVDKYAPVNFIRFTPHARSDTMRACAS